MIELEEIRDTPTTVEVEPNLQQPVVESHIPRRSERIIRPPARYTLLHEQGHDEPNDGCDPRNFKEAISDAESSKWLEAMQSEIDSISDRRWIVTQFLTMNLKDWLHGSWKRHKQRNIPLPPFKDRLAKALEIAQAMQYLHQSNPKIVHRDLKPSNIFLDDALHVRVADFGHARFLSDGEKALTGETGTFIYMAPEVISCGAYDEKCDVYSFGVILNELVSGEYPYIDTDYGPSKIALEVAENGLRPSIAKAGTYLEEMIIELIQQLWDQEPAARPSFNEITCNLRNILGDNI
ncbi:serine/threonine-protein kinase STY17-like [Henckelia pumila]|uniref:serine/threonine-protein kinase STY17-like n=1 Tax=Henckelia pumila TaxID=405737 RepID=UPI003C6DF78E